MKNGGEKMNREDFPMLNKNEVIPDVIRSIYNTDDFICGKNKQFVFRSPYTIGKELWEYLHSHPSTPKGINIDKPNDLIEWLNTI